MRIEDDGPGYPAELMTRLGEPFVTTRSSRQTEEAGYQGMGLGIFIAKTLLERRGVELVFLNRRARRDDPGGATAQLIWRKG